MNTTLTSVTHSFVQIQIKQETMPRVPHNNFHYSQADVVVDRATKLGFTWSEARPNTIIGFAPGNIVSKPLNFLCSIVF